ncbi:hypothetical protein BO82DRAFT_389144 [Aspergillus uvarum CBS 121591]|uniref:Uncharacterized protein n=1 Tax=Aspergillus uvarum CBS 121591 TaxID=1448315 RepID=A0A319CK79_9EURO|nr:hypothetical protein BO82DRAFT_389144 [Aspergillus uvarum CBS 121591]PYH86005.1 hypothetical protein BO82DRAFT_389144 [Aspergillus uvarum CBS 121591]
MVRFCSTLSLISLLTPIVLAGVIPESNEVGTFDQFDTVPQGEAVPNDEVYTDDGSELHTWHDDDDDGGGPALDTRGFDEAGADDFSYAEVDEDPSYASAAAGGDVAARAPANCDQMVRTSIDTCKRGVQSRIDTCKRNIQDNIATCKQNLSKRIDECKKKHKWPWEKARCEAMRLDGNRLCEQRKAKTPLCEKSRPQVLVCCEGLRTSVRGVCAIKPVPVARVQQALQNAQQGCMKGLVFPPL